MKTKKTPIHPELIGQTIRKIETEEAGQVYSVIYIETDNFTFEVEAYIENHARIINTRKKYLIFLQRKKFLKQLTILYQFHLHIQRIFYSHLVSYMMYPDFLHGKT